MRRTRLAAMVAVAASMLALAATANASLQAPSSVARTGLGDAPRVFVNQRGTVNVLWLATNAARYTKLGYARKPAGAKRFSTVKLPNMPFLAGDEPFIYEPSPGVMEIILDVALKVYAWRSTNDGRSWTSMDTSALNALEPDGVYIPAQELVDAPGGPILYAGSNGGTGDVVQLKSDLSGVTKLASNTQALNVLSVARTNSGATFILGAPAMDTTPTLPFQVGTTMGQVSFPTCANESVGEGTTSITAGRSVAVVAVAGCGKVQTRTISASGAVGPVVTIGSTPVNTVAGNVGRPWVQLTTSRNGTFAAAFVTKGADLSVAHSANGSRWTTAPGLVPIASALGDQGGQNGALSTGSPTWYGWTTETKTTDDYAVTASPVSNTYRAPRAPSGHGLLSPRHAVIGSLAATAPGKVSLKSFRRNGKLTLRLIDATPDLVTASITTTRMQGSTQYDICAANGTAKLAAGRVRTMTLACAGSSVVIGGTAASGVAVKRGDLVTVTLTGRNGPLTFTARVG